MRARAFVGWLALSVFCGFPLQSGAAADRDGEPLDGKEWQALTLITGFHSVQDRKTGLSARLLEADGSATVAWDPVTLYLVVESGGAPNTAVHTWRLPRGVAGVKTFVATACGADVRVNVDRATREDRIKLEGEVHGTVPLTLRLCFLGPDGKVQERLRVSEISRRGAAEPRVAADRAAPGR